MERTSQGFITFDGLIEESFVNLVQSTLGESEFIETKFGPIPNHPDDGLIIYQLEDEAGRSSTLDQEASDPDEGSKISVTGTNIKIDEPHYEDTHFNITPAGTPSGAGLSINFMYGRPVLYVHEPGREEVKYMIALPWKDQPSMEICSGYVWNEEALEKLKENNNE